MRTSYPLAFMASLLIASAAQAQSNVQVFGVLDTLGYRKQLAGETATRRVDSGGMTTSFWGLRGSEDLGNGLKAQFELTSFLRVDTGAAGRSDTDVFYGRGAWVGLQGSAGSLRLGRQTTLGWLNLVRYSAFGASSVFGPSFLHNYLPSATQPMMTGSGAADSAWNNTVGYTSPDIGGLVGSVLVAASEGTTAGRRMAGGVAYAKGAFSAGLVLERIEAATMNFSKPPASVPIRESEIVNLGVSYDFQVAKAFGQVIRTRLRNATTQIDLDSYNLGLAAPLGPGRALASYGLTKRSQTALAGQERRTLSVGYEYPLSKRTDIYTAAMHDRVTALSSGTGFAVGLRHRF